jgi:hypothetical protein
MFSRTARIVLQGLRIINAGDLATGNFPGTARYWEERYRRAGTSGIGSYGPLARAKARFINDYVRRHGIRTVVDFGAGDGNQLRLLELPQYVGLDVSPTAICRLRRDYSSDPSKRFVLCNGAAVRSDPALHAELGLSLDVIYHLVEQETYERYLQDLFHCAQRHVIIYSSDLERPHHVSGHVRHRKFTTFVEEHFPEWRLVEVRRNPHRWIACSDFFVFRRGD